MLEEPEPLIDCPLFPEVAVQFWQLLFAGCDVSLIHAVTEVVVGATPVTIFPISANFHAAPNSAWHLASAPATPPKLPVYLALENSKIGTLVEVA
jgi:hypothetical protein